MEENGFIKIGYANGNEPTEDVVKEEQQPVTVENNVEPEVKQPEENIFITTNDDGPEPKVEKPDYNNYSSTALIALSEIEEGILDIKKEDVPEDLDAKGLRDLYRNYSEKLTNQRISEIRDEYSEYSQYIDKFKNGATQEEVKASITLQDLINSDVNDVDNAKTLIETELAMKNLNKEDIDAIVEKIVISDEYAERAKKSQEFFKQKDQEIEETVKQRREREIQNEKDEIERINNGIKEFINQDAINGIPMNEIKRKEFEDVVYKPTEVITYNDENGNKQQTKMTKAQELIYRFQNDITLQLEFVHFMLNKDGIKSANKSERDSELLDLANRVTQKNNKGSSITNGFKNYLDN